MVLGEPVTNVVLGFVRGIPTRKWWVRFATMGLGYRSPLCNNCFDSFFGSTSRENERQSVGLGLAITQRAVRLHGGEVSASNAPGWARSNDHFSRQESRPRMIHDFLEKVPRLFAPRRPEICLTRLTSPAHRCALICPVPARLDSRELSATKLYRSVTESSPQRLLNLHLLSVTEH
jgi:hypothetical protein